MNVLSKKFIKTKAQFAYEFQIKRNNFKKLKHKYIKCETGCHGILKSYLKVNFKLIKANVHWIFVLES